MSDLEIDLALHISIPMAQAQRPTHAVSAEARAHMAAGQRAHWARVDAVQQEFAARDIPISRLTAQQVLRQRVLKAGKWLP